jgi:hypothetical protein
MSANIKGLQAKTKMIIPDNIKGLQAKKVITSANIKRLQEKA